MFWLGVSIGFFYLFVLHRFFIKICNRLNFLNIFILNLFLPFLLVVIEVFMVHFSIILFRPNFLDVRQHRLSIFFLYFFADLVELVGKTVPDPIMDLLLWFLLNRFFLHNFLFFYVLLFNFEILSYLFSCVLNSFVGGI